MAAMSRRRVPEASRGLSGAAGLLVANAAELRANPLGLPIGSQVYPLRSMLKDFPAFVEDDGRDRRDAARAVFADRLRQRTSRRSRTGTRSGRSWPITA